MRSTSPGPRLKPELDVAVDAVVRFRQRASSADESFSALMLKDWFAEAGDCVEATREFCPSGAEELELAHAAIIKETQQRESSALERMYVLIWVYIFLAVPPVENGTTHPALIRRDAH
jgi:hypothetical protein